MNAPDEMLTESEWRRRDLERRCNADGHVPSTTVTTWKGPSVAFCECGSYRYTAHRVRLPDGSPVERDGAGAPVAVPLPAEPAEAKRARTRCDCREKPTCLPRCGCGTCRGSGCKCQCHA